MKTRTPACNSRFAKAGVRSFYDSEVLKITTFAKHQTVINHPKK